MFGVRALNRFIPLDRCPHRALGRICYFPFRSCNYFCLIDYTKCPGIGLVSSVHFFFKPISPVFSARVHLPLAAALCWWEGRASTIHHGFLFLGKCDNHRPADGLETPNTRLTRGACGRGNGGKKGRICGAYKLNLCKQKHSVSRSDCELDSF